MKNTTSFDCPDEKIATNRAADELIRHFVELINTGQLKEGDPLPTERKIVETLGVSRTVVREAILALANKGLVEARHRFRPVVRKSNFDAAFDTINDVVSRILVKPGSVKYLYDTRVLIESILVRRAATDATKEDILALKQALANNREAIGNSELFYQTDMAFHSILYQIPQNPVLPAIHRAYTSWLSPRWLLMPSCKEKNQINFEAHQKIFDAILMRDPDAAEERLCEHLAYAWNQVKDYLNNDQI
ncbi:MAG: FCD domain-containing protein [Rhodobacteraceae bacterium]|nr:FCD domain-containing protein [Paracoccaceae bacterium]MYF45942.1 FCD domain-containing protein [Paracoccaceae bacterium]MYI91465.1 FCD domain-containing protein [Paracoccaceae bacterium]